MARQKQSEVRLPAALSRQAGAPGEFAAVWMFAGSSEPMARAPAAFAFIVALVLHASVGLIQAKPDHPPLSLIRTELETLIPIDTAPLPPAEPLKSPPLPNEALAPPSSHQPLIQNRGNPLDA